MNAWPRMIKRTRAAEYCDLSVAAFEREIIAGRLPAALTTEYRTIYNRARKRMERERETDSENYPVSD